MLAPKAEVSSNHPDYQGAYELLIKTSSEILKVGLYLGIDVFNKQFDKVVTKRDALNRWILQDSKDLIKQAGAGYKIRRRSQEIQAM